MNKYKFNWSCDSHFSKKYVFLSLSYLGNTYLKNTNTDADLYVFLTDITDQGWVGVAYVGVLCGVKHTRASISAYYSSDIYTAEVISFFRNNELSHFV